MHNKKIGLGFVTDWLKYNHFNVEMYLKDLLENKNEV